MDKAAEKRCIDCSASQQIKCFGIHEVSKGIGKSRRCSKIKRGTVTCKSQDR